MEIIKTQQTKRLHATVVVDSITYYRNENLIFNNEKREWELEELRWRVGDKEGKGPYVEPSGELDEFQKTTSKKLEKKFQELQKD